MYRTVKLLVRSLQIHEKLKNFINYLVRAGLWTVDLINADNYVKVKLQSFFKNEFCLRHSAFKGIYKKNYAVYHFQYTLYLSAEISVSGSVDDIDFYAFIMDSSVFGQNSDTTLTFDIIGVHDTFLYFLIFTENTALFQKLIHQSGFAMVYMGDNGNIAYIFAFGLHKI